MRFFLEGYELKYEGHPQVRGYAKTCPGCGHWLEDAENIDRPFPAGTGKCLFIALVAGVILNALYGAALGVVGGGAALVISLKFITPRDPDYYCFGCKKFWFTSDLKQIQPNVKLCNQADAGTGSWYKSDTAAGAAYCGVRIHGPDCEQARLGSVRWEGISGAGKLRWGSLRW